MRLWLIGKYILGNILLQDQHSQYSLYKPKRNADSEELPGLFSMILRKGKLDQSKRQREKRSYIHLYMRNDYRRILNDILKHSEKNPTKKDEKGSSLL